MNCNCNQSKKCCEPVPVRTCCSGSNAVSKSDFYDYKTDMETDLDTINRDLANKELKITELEIEDAKLDISKQNKLVAGNNIILTENADKTVTISSTGGGGGGSYTAGDGITIASDEISVNDTIQRKLTAGTDIQITPNNVINYIGSGGHMTKTEILNELGLQEIQCIIKDDQGVERTATVVGLFGTTPPTPPTQDIVIDIDSISENTMSWRDSYTCQLKEFSASRGEVTPVPLGQADAEVKMTVSGVTLGNNTLGDFTGTTTVQGGMLVCQTDSKYDSLYGTVYFTVEASNAAQDEVWLLLHSSSGMEPAQMCRINNLYVEVLDPGHD